MVTDPLFESESSESDSLSTPTKIHLMGLKVTIFGLCVIKVPAGSVSIHTLDRHTDRYSIDISIDTRSTLYQHLINSQSIVGQVLTDSYASIEN